jgi:membrane protease YdiL (CAAX protease family)
LARHFGLTWETLAYIPGLLVGVTIVVLLLWRGIPNDISATLATKTFFFAALIVPMVEEVVFRLGVFRLLPAHLSPLAKVTYSALVFACAHGRYGEQWFIPPAGLPIGPLLLGLSCGAVFALSGRLMPAILLHAVCNATGFVYPLVLDDEQFSWLRWLYG